MQNSDSTESDLVDQSLSRLMDGLVDIVYKDESFMTERYNY